MTIEADDLGDGALNDAGDAGGELQDKGGAKPLLDDAGADADEGDNGADKAGWGDDWRDKMAGGDADLAKLLQRYSSPSGIAKALKESKDTIRSGKLKRDAPDPSDEKAMAEWRKEQGIPDDPTGYKLPEPVASRLVDADKPILAAFTEFAHEKGAPQNVIDIATEWYVETQEKAAEQQAENDRAAMENAESALRKELSHGEYKSTLTLGKRYIAEIPGIGDRFTEFRGPDGRRLGDDPDFILWAADRGREKYGDVAFASPDGEARHTARKTEIEKVMKEDINAYYEQGLDKEYDKILQREAKRR